MLVDHNSISPWWQRVRDACSQSEQNCAAYVTGLVCRKVAADFVASQTEAKVWMPGWSFVLDEGQGVCGGGGGGKCSTSHGCGFSSGLKLIAHS